MLEKALAFVSTEARHQVIDAVACELHNVGYQLEGNTEAFDAEWLARMLWSEETGAMVADWDLDQVGMAETRIRYITLARSALKVLPAYQERVAHRLVALSKVMRDLERGLRVAKREQKLALGERTR
jgi:hypothetical protein